MRSAMFFFAAALLLAVVIVRSETHDSLQPITTTTNASLFLRVSVISNGSYDSLRQSLVWRGPPIHRFEDVPSHRFYRKWTQFSFATRKLAMPKDFPKQGESVRGLFVADVCASSKFVPCTFGAAYGVAEKLSWLVNTLTKEQSLDFWSLIGDNFYDEDGTITESFFSTLTWQAQSIPLLAVPGNHDYWTLGSPSTTANNQFGIGFAQFYMMDTEAAMRAPDPSFPFIFPQISSGVDILPMDSNYFHYSIVGGAGFIAFSGGHAMNTDKFETACRYFSKGHPGEKAHFVFLLSHWSHEHMGCEHDMYSARVHELMSMADGPMNKYCYPLFAQKRLYFVDGHFHENQVLGPFGMRVAGQGMIDTGTFGFPLVEITAPVKLEKPRLIVYYVSLATHSYDPLIHFRFRQLQHCAKIDGVFGCLPKLNFVKVWFNATADR